MYRIFFKRFCDIIISSIALLILSPVLIITWIALSFANKGAGAFFFQERPGMGSKIFKIYKFKSMTDERDNEGNLLPDAVRLTKIGNFIRRTSIDELPQLWNVFKGDMSIIGPRPLLIKYLPYYTQREKLRHSVRPGITGLAQINGRNENSWDEKVMYDNIYIDEFKKQGVLLDIKILVGTVVKVLKKQDIFEEKLDNEMSAVEAAKFAEEEIIRVAHLPDEVEI